LGPYDSIAITAACGDVPPPLVEQLKVGGRLIGPVRKGVAQHLVLLEKDAEGVRERALCQVLYVPLRGVYGA
jgi:protein-L-isoaspartate(D-aspartate) O-methyltransferase